MKEITRFYGIPKEIVLDIDPNFTSNFWKVLFRQFKTKLNLSTTYHLQTYGQTKRANKIIEDMLQMYVMEKPSKWEYYLYLEEFS